MAKLVPIILQLSIVLSVLAFALRVDRGAALYLFRLPGKLVVSLLSMHLVMPLIALGFAGLLDLEPAVKIALMAIAVAPVSPLLPKKELKAGGDDAYAVSLFAVTALLSCVTVPISITLMGRVFGASVQVPPWLVQQTVLVTILLPLTAGIIIRGISRRVADSISRPLSIVGGVTLLIAAIALVVGAWPAMVELTGNGTLVAIFSFTALGLIVGHTLGGPEQACRIVLAFSTASRHPAVAISVAAAAAPTQKLTSGVVILYLLVSGLATRIYLRWSKRRVAAGGPFSTSGEPRPRIV